MTSVHLFAALREAAGASRVDVEATTVAGMLDELAATHGEVMARRLQVATVVVDGDTVARDDTTRDLSAAEEVVVMPPFAGG